MLQVTCIRGKIPVQVRQDLAAVQPRLQIILDILHTVITLILLILSVRIKEEKIVKVGTLQALLNPASKASILKSGPPHDHFNWLELERCAEWLGLARGLFLQIQDKLYIDRKICVMTWDILSRRFTFLYALKMLFRKDTCRLRNLALCNVFL